MNKAVGEISRALAPIDGVAPVIVHAFRRPS